VNYAVNTDSVKFWLPANKANYVLVLNDITAGIYPETVYYNGVPSNYYATKIKTSLSLFESNGVYSKKLSGMAEVPQVKFIRVVLPLYFTVHRTGAVCRL